MAAVRHLWLLKVGNSQCRTCSEGQYALPCQVSCDWSNRYRDIAIFGLFRMAAADILNFLSFKFVTVGTVSKVRTASPCQISSKSLKLRPRYGDISISQNGGCRHLGFLKSQIFNGGTRHECRIASSCQKRFSIFFIMPVLDKLQHSKMAWGRVKRFCQNQGCVNILCCSVILHILENLFVVLVD